MPTPPRHHHRSRTRPFAWRLAAVVAGLLSGSVVGCAAAEQTEATREDSLVVFAASSLRDAFTVIGNDFKRLHPSVAVTFNFAGTQQLRAQIEHGATVDVFAAADRRHMDALVRGALVVGPVVFARNEPVVVVAADADTAIARFDDLPDAARIVIGTREVPIGQYTMEILDRASATLGADFRARVETKVVSRELNVRQVLAKVALGEAQAGIVYRTDALSSQPSVRVVSIPADLNVIAEYPIAVASAAAHPTLARAWLEVVRSAAGQRALLTAGFLPLSDNGASQ